MIRLSHSSTLLVAFSLLASAATAGPPQIVRTSQMWGSETSEGKINAWIGIAAECRQEADQSLRCQFVSISVTGTDQCTVSTWAQLLQLVRRTSDTVIWAGTKGPTGLAGVVAMTRLTAQRNQGRDGNSKTFAAETPGSADTWNFISTQTHSAPVFSGKIQGPVSTEAKSGLAPSLRCGATALFAMTPLMDY
jgi:hypothetical protein